MQTHPVRNIFKTQQKYNPLLTMMDFYPNALTKNILSDTTTLSELLDRKLISVRTYNVCSRFKFKNLQQLYIHFLENKSFLKLQKLGVKSNSELINLCEAFNLSQPIDYLVIENKYVKIREVDKLYALYSSFNSTEKTITESVFISLQKKLSVRASNAIKKLSIEQTFEKTLEFLHSIDFDLSKIQNVGAKTINEIDSFLEDIFHLINRTDSAMPLDDLKIEDLKNQIQSIAFCHNNFINQFLDENYTSLESGNFPLLELMDLILKKSTIIKKGYRDLVVKYSGIYIPEEQLSNDEIAARLFLTKERVRQLLTNSQVHIKAIGQVCSIIVVLKQFGLVIPTKFILNDKSYHLAEFEDLNNGTNFSNKFFVNLLSLVNPSFIAVPFKIPDEKIIFIDTEILKAFDVCGFFEKIYEIINNKIEEDFEIHLTGFMYGYYKSVLSTEKQKIVESAIESILYELYDLYPDRNKILLINRNIKKRLWEYMIDILKKSNKPLHIGVIAEEMQLLGFDIDATAVRSYMLRMDDFFMLVGSSIYGLKEWEKDQNLVGGTIKQIIEKLLEESERPLHLYEIATFATNQRNTNIHSIHGNLQSDPGNKFRSFGQQFFGLTNKVYTKEYHFKPVSRHWFKDVIKLFKQNDSGMRTKSEILNYIARLHGVTQVQIEHLLMQRIEKGDIIEITDKLLKLK